MSKIRKTTGYNPSDTEERRIIKARCFARSMISKGQSEKDANRIAAKYYHVLEEDVRYYDDDIDDDIWFMLDGHTPIAASEMLNDGDFY